MYIVDRPNFFRQGIRSWFGEGSFLFFLSVGSFSLDQHFRLDRYQSVTADRSQSHINPDWSHLKNNNFETAKTGAQSSGRDFWHQSVDLSNKRDDISTGYERLWPCQLITADSMILLHNYDTDWSHGGSASPQCTVQNGKCLVHPPLFYPPKLVSTVLYEGFTQEISPSGREDDRSSSSHQVYSNYPHPINHPVWASSLSQVNNRERFNVQILNVQSNQSIWRKQQVVLKVLLRNKVFAPQYNFCNHCMH